MSGISPTAALVAGNTVETLRPLSVTDLPKASAFAEKALDPNISEAELNQAREEYLDSLIQSVSPIVETTPLVESRPNPWVEPITEEPTALADAQPVTAEELQDLKNQINDSFAELANALLDTQLSIAGLIERIDRYNARSSHKI